MREEDILARQSRPQRHSTWVPKSRDWRYATGVFQHDDFNDAKERSAWDTMDYDYEVVGSKRRRSGSGYSDDSNTCFDRTALLPSTPESAASNPFSTPSKSAVTLGPPRKKTKITKKSRWLQISRYKSSDECHVEGEEQPGYSIYSLTVRLRFSGKLTIEDAQSHAETPGPHIHSRASDAPNTPAPARTTEAPNSRANSKMLATPVAIAKAGTAETINTPHVLDSIESIQAIPHFKRTWVDETQDFNMLKVRTTLRQPDTQVRDLGPNYAWYTDAVPIDALFPPGIPLSAKEILAYYPHHVRWKDMMVRLVNNDYRGSDIMGIQSFFRGPPNHATTPAQMNQFQRDTVKTHLPGFKTESYTGKHDCNLSTAHMSPGKYIVERRNGFTVPSFDDLLRGLHNLPSGLDARGLTECLAWYLSSRDAFTPRLEVNVLHTQTLVRALRIPIKGFGPQNLDCNGLREWRDRGRFKEKRVVYQTSRSLGKETGMDEEDKGGEKEERRRRRRRRSQLHINLDSQDVSLDVEIPLRHVLVFPFLALHGVVGEALKMGISKAERRLKERRQGYGTTMTEEKSSADEMNMVEQPAAPLKEPPPSVSRTLQAAANTHTGAEAGAEAKTPFRTSARPLTTANLRTLAPALRKPTPARTAREPFTPPRMPTSSRHEQSQPYMQPSPAPRRPSVSSHQQHTHSTPDTAHTRDGQWDTRRPTYRYQPPSPQTAAQPSSHTRPHNAAHERERGLGQASSSSSSSFAPAYTTTTSHDAYTRRYHEYDSRRESYRHGRDDRRGNAWGYGYEQGQGYTRRTGREYYHSGWSGDGWDSRGDGYGRQSVYRR